LPQHGSLDRRDFQSQHDYFPTDCFTPRRLLAELPREQQLYDVANGLLRVPHGQLTTPQPKSGSRGSRGSRQLVHLPHAAAGPARLFNHTYARESRQCQAVVRYVPYESRKLLGFPMYQCTERERGQFQSPNLSGYVYNSVNCYQCHKRQWSAPGGSPVDSNEEIE